MSQTIADRNYEQPYSAILADAIEKPGLPLPVEPGGRGKQREEINCQGSFAKSRPTIRTASLNVFADGRKLLRLEGAEQVKFVDII